jgi:hypothetical protein
VHLTPQGIISRTHKRTEGHAPVWGSEFTSKDAALQGVVEIAARLNAELLTSVTGGGRILPPILAQSYCGVIFFLTPFPRGSLHFCPSGLAARLPARNAALGKTRRVFDTAAFFFVRTRWIPKQRGASSR